MGLDMYFYEREWLGGNVDVVVKEPLREVKDVVYLTREVGYLRKANCIHGRIVEECADGEDDQRMVRLPKWFIESMIERIGSILDVVRNGGDWVEVAKRELPTCEGFFFGSTEYDESYLDDLRDALDIFIKIFADLEESGGHLDCYYEASW